MGPLLSLHIIGMGSCLKLYQLQIFTADLQNVANFNDNLEIQENIKRLGIYWAINLEKCTTILITLILCY